MHVSQQQRMSNALAAVAAANGMLEKDAARMASAMLPSQSDLAAMKAAQVKRDRKAARLAALVGQQ